MKRGLLDLGLIAVLVLSPTAVFWPIDAACAADSAIPIGPYLQNPAPDAMTVMFCTDAADPCVVEYGRAKNRFDHKAAVVRASAQEASLFKARLEGLEPGTVYYYRIATEKTGNVLSDAHSFTTQNPKAAKVTALFFNDLHNNIPLLRKMQPLWRDIPFDFMLFNGDCWPDAERFRSLAMLTAVPQICSGADQPMLFLRGNHEYRGPWHDTLMDFFDVPMRQENKYYFAFTQGPVRFVCLDCGEDEFKREAELLPYREEELRWIKQETTGQPFKEAKYRVLVTHLALYGIHPNDSSQPCHALWSSAVDKACFDLCIAAHVHTPCLLLPADVRVYNTPADVRKNPYSILVGGGPAMDGPEAGTMILLEADDAKLRARTIGVDGKTLYDCKVLASGVNNARDGRYTLHGQ